MLVIAGTVMSLARPEKTYDVPLLAALGNKFAGETDRNKIDWRLIPAVMQRIAWCESRDRQFNPDGSVFRGKQNPHDVGEFQINENWWGMKAESLGYDIYTREGNTEMALYIYKNVGVSAWSWSSGCWSANKI